MPPPPRPDNVDEHPFLGQDFLVWLWWRAETRGGLYALAEDVRAGIALDRLLEFHDESTGVKVQVRGDAPTRAPEAREALSRGMRLIRAGLIVSLSDENIALVLDGTTFDLRSVKGEAPEGDDVGERDANALATLFGLVDTLDRVYQTYLAERVEARFTQEVAPEILAWARSASRTPRVDSAPGVPVEVGESAQGAG